MEEIVFVSGNNGKLHRMQRKFKDASIEIDTILFDLNEPDVNDITYISKEKAKQAYDRVKRSCFVVDSGFYIEDYPKNPGYPGAFAKRSGVTTDLSSLLVKMQGVKNRSCKFMDCLTFYNGRDFYSFYGESRGSLSYEKRGVISEEAKSPIHLLFIPEGSKKTLGELTKAEIDRFATISATDQFIKWYKQEYLSQVNKQKKICIS